MSILWRACAAQALVVGALFALLVVLPLPRELFREFGALVGPLSWLGCSLVVARMLRLRIGSALAAAALSGLVAVAVNAVVGHAAGIVAGILAFGVGCGLAAGASGPRLRDAGRRRRVGATGIEPVTSGLKGRRPNR